MVLKAYRNHGIGKALLWEVERIARDRKCCKITLEVQMKNTAARGIYQSGGRTVRLWMVAVVLAWDSCVAVAFGRERLKRLLGRWVFRIEKVSGLLLAVFGVLLAVD